MFTDKRLLDAYKNAKVEEFDKNSKYIFLSDCHRGNDSIADEFTKNKNIFLHALNYYYDRDYTFVEVGDGDELMQHSKFKHIRLAHDDVFDTIKKFYDRDKFILIYGNHNIFLRDKDYVSKNYHFYYDEYNMEEYELFNGITPLEGLVLKYKNTGQELLVVHGHQGDLMNDQLWVVSLVLLRYFWRFMHVIGFRNPSSPAKNQYKRHKIEKNYGKWIKKHKKILICGHTHRPRFPKAADVPYFNTGSCIRTRGITGIEIEDGNIIMVDWGIKPSPDGVLLVERNIMRGPQPVESFHF